MIRVNDRLLGTVKVESHPAAVRFRRPQRVAGQDLNRALDPIAEPPRADGPKVLNVLVIRSDSGSRRNAAGEP